MSLYGNYAQSKEIRRKLNWKSSVMDASIAHAESVKNKTRVIMEPMALDGRKINVRVSKTFASSIFDNKDQSEGLKTQSKVGNGSNGKKVEKNLKKVGKISDILAKGQFSDAQWRKDIDEVNKTQRHSPIDQLRERNKADDEKTVFIEQNKKFRAATPEPPRALSPCSCISLEISSTNNIESENLKEQFKGYHIVSMISPYSLISGKLSNSASVVIKTSDPNIQPLIKRLECKGMNVSQKVQTLGKRNLEDIGRDRGFSPEISRSFSRNSTRHHLETSDDLFGSSPGVGRFVSRSKTPDKQAQIIHSWNTIHRPTKETPINNSFISGPNYMKSTQSWSNKSRKYF